MGRLYLSIAFALRAHLDMVEQHMPADRGTVVPHWFTESLAEARRAVDLGCYFSIDGRTLTNERGVKLVTSLPENRFVTETDGPLVSVDRGSDPICPANVAATLASLACAREITEARCKHVLLRNLRNLTGADAR